jgi:hypothetical protein
MEKQSSTKRFQTLGGEVASWMALFFYHFHAQVSNNCTNRAAHGTSMNLFVGGVDKTKYKSRMMSSMSS